MEQALLLSVIIAILYFITKMLESKYVNKIQEPLKYVVRDTLIVSACVIFCFIYVFSNVWTNC